MTDAPSLSLLWDYRNPDGFSGCGNPHPIVDVLQIHPVGDDPLEGKPLLSSLEKIDRPLQVPGVVVVNAR
jgi:hypothetical protein